MGIPSVVDGVLIVLVLTSLDWSIALSLFLAFSPEGPRTTELGLVERRVAAVKQAWGAAMGANIRVASGAAGAGLRTGGGG